MNNIARIQEALVRKDLDAILITDEKNQRYATGFAFTDGAVVVGREKAWLLTVALNRCRDLWRENWFRRVIVGSETLERKRDPHDMDEDIEKRELKEAVRRLPPAFRDVVLLHYYQGMGITEIAGILGVPEGTVSSRLSRARKRLEEDLKGE